jgi:hypothetical protein
MADSTPAAASMQEDTSDPLAVGAAAAPANAKPNRKRMPQVESKMNFYPVAAAGQNPGIGAPADPERDARPPSVHYTPLSHILPQFVPEQWTVELNEVACATVEPNREESKELPAASAAAAASSVVPSEEATEPSVSAAAAPSSSSTAPAELPLGPSSVLVTRVSLTPLMLRVSNFLSTAECAEVLRLAAAPDAPKWKPYRNVTYKPTVDPVSGAVVDQQFEVGYTETATLNQLDYGRYPAIFPLIDRFAARVACVVNSSKEYASNMRRLLRYKPGQKFELHADDFDRIKPLHRGRRLLTCLIYVHTEKDETG